MVEDDDGPCFCLSEQQLEQLRSIGVLIRRRLHSMDPVEIKGGAALLLALARLPATTPAVAVRLSFTRYGNEGNYNWLDICFWEEELRLESGEHFYDSALGGDTETDVLFEAHAGSTPRGHIEAWLDRLEELGGKPSIRVSDDSSHGEIVWEIPDEEPQGDDYGYSG
jgi:hypothetical protein